LKAHPAIVVFVIFASIVLLTAACGGDEDVGSSAVGATNSPSQTATVAATPAGVSTDPDVVLPAIAAAMAAARSWQVQAQLNVVDITDDGEQSLTTTVNAARSGPGANIIVTVSDASTGSISGSTSAENRIVDGKKYRRDPNSGEWRVSEVVDPPASLTVDADVVSQIDASTATVVEAELDGETVFHVTGTISGSDAGKVVEIFAGVDDHLVRKMTLEGTAPSSNFGGLLAISERPLPQTVEARYFEFGRAIVIHIPPGVEEIATAETQQYLSTINPLSMDVPANLKSAPRTYLTGESYSGGGGAALFIVEEYLDVETAFEGELSGKSPDVDTYARRFEIELDESGTYQVLSNESFTTDSGLEAHLIRFSEADGDVQWAHLSYFHGDDLGFGASYGAFASRYEEIEADIMTAFRSFRIVE
jgi:hypothetical protein